MLRNDCSSCLVDSFHIVCITNVYYNEAFLNIVIVIIKYLIKEVLATRYVNA